MITATAIAISLASYHFDREVKHNEVNPGVFVELNDAYVVGLYRNSNWRTTALVARQFSWYDSGGLKVGLLAGVCTGYRKPVCGGLTVGLGEHITLLVAPPVSGTSGVVGLSWRQPL